MLSATFFQDVISYDRTNGSADDEAYDDASYDSLPLGLFFTIPEWPHTSFIIADRHCVLFSLSACFGHGTAFRTSVTSDQEKDWHRRSHQCDTGFFCRRK